MARNITRGKPVKQKYSIRIELNNASTESRLSQQRTLRLDSIHERAVGGESDGGGPGINIGCRSQPGDWP